MGRRFFCACSTTSNQQQAVTVAVEAIALCHCLAIGLHH